MDLGKAAAQEDARGSWRQGLILQRAEEGECGPGLLEQLQVLRIGEMERLVPGHGDDRRGSRTSGCPPLAGGWAHAQRGGALVSTLGETPFFRCPPLAGGSFTLAATGTAAP